MIDDSEGLFGKRRKNLMIVGVIIIILALLNPTIDDITLFGIKFYVAGKLWVIWIGLTVWFAYASMRVYSYHNSYIRHKLVSSKNMFVYWEGEGHKYWDRFLETKRKEIEDNMKVPDSNIYAGVNFSRLALSGIGADALQHYISVGEIPGTIRVYFTKEHPGMTSLDYQQDVEFTVTDEQENYFNKRRGEYRVHDEWWEYVFTKIFGIVTASALLLGWLRIFFQF